MKKHIHIMWKAYSIWGLRIQDLINSIKNGLGHAFSQVIKKKKKKLNKVVVTETLFFLIPSFLYSSAGRCSLLCLHLREMYTFKRGQSDFIHVKQAKIWSFATRPPSNLLVRVVTNIKERWVMKLYSLYRATQTASQQLYRKPFPNAYSIL